MQIINTQINSNQELLNIILEHINNNLKEEVYRCQRYSVSLGIQLFKTKNNLLSNEELIKEALRLTDKYYIFNFNEFNFLLVFYPHSNYLGCDKVSQKMFHFLSNKITDKLSSSFSILENAELKQVINGILSGIELVYELDGNHITHYSCEDKNGLALFNSY